jgi:hypothetical protein
MNHIVYLQISVIDNEYLRTDYVKFENQRNLQILIRSRKMPGHVSSLIPIAWLCSSVASRLEHCSSLTEIS